MNGQQPNLSYNVKTTRAYGRYVHETPGDYFQRLGNILSALEGISSTHIDWFTHRDGRATSCWICEVLLLCRVLAGELDALYGQGVEGGDTKGATAVEIFHGIRQMKDETLNVAKSE